jgi:hypothetical protein
MARTNAIDVKGIIKTSLSNDDIDNFIGDANLIITEKLSGANVNEDLKEGLEKWLAAHLIAMSKKRQLQGQKVSDVDMRYAGKFGLNLEHTTYGQTVILLDPTGILRETRKRPAKLRSINPNRTTY